MVKSKTQIKILSIVPASRYLSFAIFYDTDLRDWGIKDIRDKKLDTRINKAKEIISELINRYEPKILAIKELDSIRTSSNLDTLNKAVIEFARKKGLEIQKYTLKEIKSSLSPGQRINKKDLAKIIISLYQSLFYDFQKEKNNLNPYYLKEFEAVSLGSICFDQINKEIIKIKMNKNEY